MYSKSPMQFNSFHAISAYFYRPQTKFAKVTFSQVSVCPQAGGLPHCMLGYTPHLPGRYTPRAGTPPRCLVHAGIHPPVQCILGYDQQAGGTHPTGMHSCCLGLTPLFRILRMRTVVDNVPICRCNVLKQTPH